jgi:hypothetical protein
MSQRLAGARALAAAGCCLLVAGGLPAREVDPTLPLRLAMDPVMISRRSNLGDALLPRSASVAFRLRVAAALTRAPTATAERTVLLAHAEPLLAEYDGRGRVVWAARLGPSPAAASPFVFADGTRAVITEGGELLGFSRRGRAVSRSRLPFGTIGSNLLIEPTADGGLLISEGQQLVRIDATGTVISDVRLGVEVRALLSDVERSAGPAGKMPKALVVSAAGSVLELTPDGRANPRSRFSGAVTAAVRLDARRLLAVIDERRLVELDVIDDTERLRAETPDLELSGTLAVNRAGESRVLASGDFLLAYDSRIEERFRVSLSQPGGGPSAGTLPELLLDRAGTALVVGPGVGAVSVAADGLTTRIDGSACPEPLRPAVLSSGSVVIACRSGILLRLDADDTATERRTPVAPAGVR